MVSEVGNKLNYYKDLASRIRINSVRMTNNGRSGHVGSMLSMADLVAVLYGGILRVKPEDPSWADRDRFILSKGHAGGGIYAALTECGFFPKDWLLTYYKDNGKLSGHISHHVPGVEFSTGALGHGLPVGLGMAIAARNKKQNHRIFCLLSEGDCNEGSTWEAIMFAAQQKLDNVIVIVDYNRVQSLGTMEEILELEPFAQKLELFGWAVREIDGHNHQQIEEALTEVPLRKGKPTWIIARTTKGKGITHMENTVSCHYTFIKDEQLEETIKILEAQK
jgi:transketolase